MPAPQASFQVGDRVRLADNTLNRTYLDTSSYRLARESAQYGSIGDIGTIRSVAPYIDLVTVELDNGLIPFGADNVGKRTNTDRWELVTQPTTPEQPTEQLYIIELRNDVSGLWVQTLWRHDGNGRNWHPLTLDQAHGALRRAQTNSPYASFRIATHPGNEPLEPTPVADTETDDAIDDDVIGQCWDCSADVTEDNSHLFTESGDMRTGRHLICTDCRDNQYPCDRCAIYTDDTTEILPNGHSYCSVCRDDSAEQCEHCEYWYRNNEMASSYQCMECYSCDCGERDCSDCYPDGPDTSELHSYSYKPEPIFQHSATSSGYMPLDNAPYFGLELEIGVDAISDSVNELTSAAPELIYCKEDGSVNGLEMVTHPMTLAAAKELIPFQALRTLRNDYGASAYSHGIHVHVSRSGFSSDVHVYRWMKLFYRNPDDVKRIARRDSAEWASFSDTERKNQKYTAEKVKGKRADKHGIYTRRYSAINVENRATFEVRVFRGSLRKDEILASIELVAASVEYARQLTTTDIIRNDGWSWSQFIMWADSQGDTYRELVDLDTKTAIKAKRDAIAAKAEQARQAKAEAEYAVTRTQRDISEFQYQVESYQRRIAELTEQLATNRAELDRTALTAMQTETSIQAELAEFEATYGNSYSQEMAEL